MVSARAFAAEVHARFQGRPLSEHIATQTAIEGLVRWLRRKRPRRVFELGAGIGTLTYATVETLTALHGESVARLISTEPYPPCREQLEINLAEQRDRFIVIDGPGDVAPDDGPFDFLITDGGDPKDASAFQNLAPGAIVFIEGDRKLQTAALEGALEGRAWQSADVRTLRRRALPGGGRVYDGGYRIYALEPTLATRLTLLRLRLTTSVVYRLRPLLGR